MSRPVRWTTRAAKQLEAAGMYLEDSRKGTGVEFIDQVESILEVASDHPNIFPRVPGVSGDEIRRGLSRKYGYWVIYELRKQDLLVLAVWHGSREPQGWKKA